MYRFKPTYRFTAYPFHIFPSKCEQAKCIMHNIMNNLDPEVAQFPEELITYVKLFLFRVEMELASKIGLSIISPCTILALFLNSRHSFLHLGILKDFILPAHRILDLL